jgi:hypothetical protein
MICVELAFDGDPRRLRMRPQHRRRLERLHAEGALSGAGPWSDDSGALLVFALDEAQVRALMDEDPYYSAPGVTVVAVRGWAPILGTTQG